MKMFGAAAASCFDSERPHGNNERVFQTTTTTFM